MYDVHQIGNDTIMKRLWGIDIHKHGMSRFVPHERIARLHPSQDLGHIGTAVLAGLDLGIDIRVQLLRRSPSQWTYGTGTIGLSAPPECYRITPKDLLTLDPLHEMFNLGEL